MKHNKIFLKKSTLRKIIQESVIRILAEKNELTGANDLVSDSEFEPASTEVSSLGSLESKTHYNLKEFKKTDMIEAMKTLFGKFLVNAFPMEDASKRVVVEVLLQKDSNPITLLAEFKNEVILILTNYNGEITPEEKERLMTIFNMKGANPIEQNNDYIMVNNPIWKQEMQEPEPKEEDDDEQEIEFSDGDEEEIDFSNLF